MDDYPDIWAAPIIHWENSPTRFCRCGHEDAFHDDLGGEDTFCDVKACGCQVWRHHEDEYMGRVFRRVRVTAVDE